MRRDYPKVAGPGRRFLIVVLALGAIAIGADAGARALAESRLASSVQESFDLAERPDIELHGFPFLLQVARGEIDTLSVELGEVTVEGLPFDRVSLELDRLRFDQMSLLGGSGDITVQRGTGQAVLTQDALSGYLQDQGTPVLVRLNGPGIRVSTRINTGADTTTASAEGRVEVDSGRLVFAPDRVEVEGTVGVPAAALGFEVPLPELVPGIRYERVLVSNGVAAIEANLSGASLRFAA